MVLLSFIKLLLCFLIGWTRLLGDYCDEGPSGPPGSWIFGEKGQSCTETCGASTCQLSSIEGINSAAAFTAASNSASAAPTTLPTCADSASSTFTELVPAVWEIDPMSIFCKYFDDVNAEGSTSSNCVPGKCSSDCGASSGNFYRLCCCGDAPCV